MKNNGYFFRSIDTKKESKMLNRKKINTQSNNKLKKIFWTLVICGISLPFFNSCNGNEELPNPNEQKIKQLEKDILANDVKVREAFEPAKTQPYDIAEGFNNTFLEEGNKLLGRNPKDIADTCLTIIPTAERYEPSGKWGNPENMTILKAWATNGNTMRAELAKLLQNGSK